VLRTVQTDETIDALSAPALGKTLEALEDAVHYRDWLFAAAAPHLGRRVLEVGSGTGTMTACVADRDRVVALEVDPEYAEQLRRRFGALENIVVVLGSATDRDTMLRAAAGVDSAMSFNVMEHIADDLVALRNVRDVLPSGGRFFCFVPAFPSLYGTMDRALGHVRRYTKTEIVDKMRRAGFVIADVHHFNLPGFFVWLVNGRVLRSRGAAGGSRSVLAYDRLIVPMSRKLEQRWRPPFGQSLVVVGERP